MMKYVPVALVTFGSLVLAFNLFIMAVVLNSVLGTIIIGTWMACMVPAAWLAFGLSRGYWYGKYPTQPDDVWEDTVPMTVATFLVPPTLLLVFWLTKRGAFGLRWKKKRAPENKGVMLYNMICTQYAVGARYFSWNNKRYINIPIKIGKYAPEKGRYFSIGATNKAYMMRKGEVWQWDGKRRVFDGVYKGRDRKFEPTSMYDWSDT